MNVGCRQDDLEAGTERFSQPCYDPGVLETSEKISIKQRALTPQLVVRMELGRNTKGMGPVSWALKSHGLQGQV